MPPKITNSKKVRRGRPAVFDRGIALVTAMKLFWERGYQGTSFDDLKDAMGISASSFYNAFESKEALYREATAAYLEGSGSWFSEILSEDIDVRSAFQKLFENVVFHYTREDCPSGCMISLAGTHLPPHLAQLRELMTDVRKISEAAFVDRLREGRMKGQIPSDTDIEAVAAFYDALSRGLAVQARDGASRKKLMSIVEIGMKAFPTTASVTN